MRKFLFTTIALLVVSAFLASPAFSAPLSIKVPRGKVRSGPGTNYKVLWEPIQFTPLEVLCKYKDWYAVRDYEGDVGWINDVAVDSHRGVIVKSKKAVVRDKPDSNADVLFNVEKGYSFNALDTKKGWFKVQDKDGDSGWIATEDVWTSD